MPRGTEQVDYVLPCTSGVHGDATTPVASIVASSIEDYRSREGGRRRRSIRTRFVANNRGRSCRTLNSFAFLLAGLSESFVFPFLQLR